MTTITSQIMEMGRQARRASAVVARSSADLKNRALAAMADALVRNGDRLIRENEKDLASARDGGLSAAMIDRLTLTEKTIAGIARGLAEVASLPDPSARSRPCGGGRTACLSAGCASPSGSSASSTNPVRTSRRTRAALCLKSGNAVILRGGSEAIHSNLAIGRILQDVLRDFALPETAIQVVPLTDREAVYEMLQLESSST